MAGPRRLGRDPEEDSVHSPEHSSLGAFELPSVKLSSVSSADIAPARESVCAWAVSYTGLPEPWCGARCNAGLQLR